MKSSLYLHIPFCISKCNYCDFTSFDNPDISVAEYSILLQKELHRAADRLKPTDAPTIYFGGGTPSLLPPALIAGLIDTIRNSCGVAPDVEVTLEANPGTIQPESLSGYLEAGVNRLSIGVQSFDNRQLALLGRIHSADEARKAFASARQAGFGNISIDLIHGLPTQSLREWETTLYEAVSMKPEHISAYGLSVEDGTAFASLEADGKLHLPEEEQAVAMLELTTEILGKAGYEHYEISNFALPGHRSRHNQVYWRRENYLGFGTGAHSFLNSPDFGCRWENAATLSAYAIGIKTGTRPDRPVALSRQEAMAEFMFLGLRMLAGVDTAEFTRQFGMNMEEAFPSTIGMLSGKGLLLDDGATVRLTPQGLLLANRVMQEFV